MMMRKRTKAIRDIHLSMMTERIKTKMHAEAANTSPMPPSENTYTITMSFYDALREVVENGKRMTKLEWGNEKSYMFLKDEKLKIALGDGTAHDFILRDADILGMDWIPVSE